jgi:hypothetical protein
MSATARLRFLDLHGSGRGEKVSLIVGGGSMLNSKKDGPRLGSKFSNGRVGDVERSVAARIILRCPN